MNCEGRKRTPGKCKVGKRNTEHIERAEGGKAMKHWDLNTPDRHLLSCSSSSTTGSSMVLWRMADPGGRPLDLGLTAIPSEGFGWKTVGSQGHFHALLATSPSPPVSHGHRASAYLQEASTDLQSDYSHPYREF